MIIYCRSIKYYQRIVIVNIKYLFMYIENDPYIELIINTWISEIGELFDFNTTK